MRTVVVLVVLVLEATGKTAVRLPAAWRPACGRLVMAARAVSACGRNSMALTLFTRLGGQGREGIQEHSVLDLGVLEPTRQVGELHTGTGQEAAVTVQMEAEAVVKLKSVGGSQHDP
jgi:hypothetical protein